MKLSLDHLNEQAEDDEMKEDDEFATDEDDDEPTFGRLAHLSCLLNQLKREKQGKHWIQMQH